MTSVLSDVQVQNHEMIVKLHAQYQYDRIAAIREASKIQRELSRTEHEISRLDQHIRRIEDFCKKNNISLESEA
jgi:hypothetical protein